VWTRATGMVKLEDYLRSLGGTGFKGWRLDTANAISGDGSTIAGWGYRPDGHVQSWIVRNLPPCGCGAGVRAAHWPTGLLPGGRPSSGDAAGTMASHGVGRVGAPAGSSRRARRRALSGDRSGLRPADGARATPVHDRAAHGRAPR